MLFLFSGTAIAHGERCYAEIGFGSNHRNNIFETPLGKVVAGCRNEENWSIEIEHISSIPDTEDESLEVLWVIKRMYFY
jgi:hypothetical protein